MHNTEWTTYVICSLHGLLDEKEILKNGYYINDTNITILWCYDWCPLLMWWDIYPMKFYTFISILLPFDTIS